MHGALLLTTETLVLNTVSAQVAGVDMADGIAQVQLAEMVVSGLALRYVDRKSGEARDEGRTRPEVIMRQLTTRPGQVGRLGLINQSHTLCLARRGPHAP